MRQPQPTIVPEEAERFGKWVMPILREHNRERMLAA